MDTDKLHVSYHAVLQFARRAEGRPLPDDHQFSGNEKASYCWAIRNRVKQGIELPSQCCLIFVKPGRRMKSAESRVWGTYVYDGEYCYVIEDNIVATVIRPDSDQFALLEELLERPPLAEADEDSIVARARDVNRQRMTAESSSLISQVGDIEICTLRNFVNAECTSDPKCVAEAMRWLDRADPKSERPVRLVITPVYHELARVLARAYPNALHVEELPANLLTSGKNPLSISDPAYHTACELLTIVPKRYARVFVLIARRMLPRVLGIVARLTADIDPDPNVWPRGAVLKIDLGKPNQKERASKFVLSE